MLKTYVDMSMINFSVARDVLYTIKSSTGKPFRQDFKSFMKAMKFRMEEFLTKGEQSLRHVIEQFKRDTEG